MLLAGKNAILARAQSWIYAVTNDGSIVRFRRGASVQTLLTGRTNLRAVIADNETLYWAEGNQVMRMPLQGGTPEAVMLNTLTAGDFAGELGFIDGTERYACLVALGEVRVLGLERARLESLLPEHPEIVYRVMRAIIRTVHQIQRRLHMQSVELSNYIYKQHGRY